MFSKARAKIVFCCVCLLWSLGVAAGNDNVGGIPSGYQGVMLQGFYWNSFSDSSWSTLTTQAEELAEFFDLIWIPQSGRCLESGMGYMDYCWFPNSEGTDTGYSSSFGTESELRSMISTFKSLGLGTIADVVINHRDAKNGTSFPTEYYNNVDYTMGSSDVCANDDYAYALGGSLGAYDTGDDFAGARDLDHTSSHVQTVVKAYLDFLLNDLGYTGFRYDMVKGYGAQYINTYNTSANPAFSVGEYWDDTDKIETWISGTNYQSGAFDFGLKYELQNACNSGTNWNQVGNGGGLIDNATYRRYAVTFVDNHDTVYRNDGTNDAGNECTNNVLAANAFILAAPGTPCIFLSHWQNSSYKDELKQMIHARKLAGVCNDSYWTCGWWSTSSWSGLATGTQGTVLVVLGNNSSSGSTVVTDVDMNDYYCIASGNNYAYYISKDVNSVWMSKPSGTYSGSVTLTALTNNSNATIVYTLDGSEPTATSATCMYSQQASAILG